VGRECCEIGVGPVRKRLAGRNPVGRLDPPREEMQTEVERPERVRVLRIGGTNAIGEVPERSFGRTLHDNPPAGSNRVERAGRNLPSLSRTIPTNARILRYEQILECSPAEGCIN